MNRNLTAKTILIVGLTALAAWTLYPPSKTLKPGIDLAGGTSLIYAIDTEGLSAAEESGLAQRMITVLRRRIDPASIQNLVWRPQGNTRFEIQMPLASENTRRRREAYEHALDALLRKNVNPASILRAMQEPAEQRAETLRDFAQGDPNHLIILQQLASVHDQRKQLQDQRDDLAQKLEQTSAKLSAAGVDMGRVEANRRDWAKLSGDELTKALKDFLGSEEQLPALTEYVKDYKDQAGVLNLLTEQGGVNDRYDEAMRKLDKLNLTLDQITYVLQLREKSPDRIQRIENLKASFPDRVEQINNVVAAFDAYRPFQGQLDDPQDLKRMLKGAGILEFRILPTEGRSELTQPEIERYKEALSDKGPKYASDNRYVWCQIENIDEWHYPSTVVAPFGDNYYVLASNRPDEALLHGGGAREWKLERAYPTTDSSGRRAIGFRLDDRGGTMFYNITGKNPGRPLCILLDGIAISAPAINPDRPIGREGVITGTFTSTEVNDMVNKLNAGSLPARLIEQPISEKIIGPSIGADNRDKGIRAAIIGLIAVIVTMLVYYLLGGAIADAALMMNILFVLAVMAGLRATFTLPGIAGIILTIGMSVDANVLIFERIREEQQRGAGLAVAIRNGYQRAFRAIFDSNVTTILTAAILYYVASEEIKGFAITLMLGIASSMFTALIVTRVVFDFLLSRRLIKDRLRMLRLIGEPRVNWMGMRKVFFVLSATLVIGGLVLFFTRDKSKYDIEFTGGTSVQINLKKGVLLSRQDVEDRITNLGNSALQSISVYSLGAPIGQTPSGERAYAQYEINTTATNKSRATVTFADSGSHTIESVTAAINAAMSETHRELADLTVAPEGQAGKAFVVTTSRVNPPLVQSVLQKAFPSADIPTPQIDEVVNDAVRTAFADDLEIQRDLQPDITSAEKITDTMVDAHPDLTSYMGGLEIKCKLGEAASLNQIDRRLRDLQFKPDVQRLTWYPHALLGPNGDTTDPNKPLDAFTFVSVGPDAGVRELSAEEWNRYVENERTRVLMATQVESSLPRVTQIDPSVGSEQKTRALIAIFLSLATIVAYVWLRFGDLRYGVAAIVALGHDVSITLGAVAISAYLASQPIGQALLISDFKINLPMIAAFLTLIGYSLNDTIVVFDRIRENRHKAQLTPQTITNSINQTMARTIMTAFTTFIVVFVMYVFGGPGLRGFNFAIGLGLIVGTYSSIAIASPLLLVQLKNKAVKAK
jgi:SecD/SecF fusion protein